MNSSSPTDPVPQSNGLDAPNPTVVAAFTNRDANVGDDGSISPDAANRDGPVVS